MVDRPNVTQPALVEVLVLEMGNLTILFRMNHVPCQTSKSHFTKDLLKPQPPLALKMQSLKQQNYTPLRDDRVGRRRLL